MDMVLRVWDSQNYVLKGNPTRVNPHTHTHTADSMVIDVGSLVPLEKAFVWNILLYRGKVWLAVHNFILRVDQMSLILVDCKWRGGVGEITECTEMGCNVQKVGENAVFVVACWCARLHCCCWCWWTASGVQRLQRLQSLNRYVLCCSTVDVESNNAVF